ncbi:MAG: hypothetical protein HKP17_09650 [Ignavibacteriaceae bacterium]|nr:hypothetical protein [Ignavibacteriaceae bacterium]
MKKSILLLFVIVSILLPIACATSGGAVDYSYQYLEKVRQDAFTEIYKYRYKIAEGEWQDIDIYVKNENFDYIINMETYFGQMQNRFVYNSLEKSQNFASQYRAVPETVNSLQEAIELALGIYIQDFKAKELE